MNSKLIAKTIKRGLKLLAFVLGGLALLLALVVTFVWHAFPFPFDKLDNWPASPRVTDRTGQELLQVVGRDDQWRQPVPLDQMSPWIIQATVAAEDERFWSHPGVDLIAVCRAVVQNLSAGRTASGASTLTMQVCRMVDDRPRTVSAKLIESCRALQLSRTRSKRDVIEAYLNIAPYGGNIRGVEAAAQTFFGKLSRDLSLGEAALLAGLPKSPSRLRPDLHPTAAIARRAHVLARMQSLGMITSEQLAEAAAEPVPAVSRQIQSAAPHAAWLALQRRPAGGETTIDLSIHRIVEQSVSRHSAILSAGADIAVVVIDVPTGDIVSLVGSSDSQDPVDGQVNGVIARRSPGSVLKPFVYAAAFEAQRLKPDSLVYDGPIDRAGWTPENFDHHFAGDVSAADALRGSLNVPAILVAEATGLPRCLGLIEAAGIDLPEDAHRRGGLAAVVGAIEVTLLDVTNGYATLARDGVRRAPRLFCDEETIANRAVGQNVCAAIGDILSSRRRRPAGMESVDDRNIPWFMWKTGTSSGRRDAWAVGHNRRYAIGVWVGRFSGGGHSEFVGKEVAEPLLATLFSIPALRQETDPPPPRVWEISQPLPLWADRGQRLRITSPSEGDAFLRVAGKATVHPRTNRQADGRWFLNGLLVGTACPKRLVLDRGSYELRCVGAQGEATAVQFRVE
jgi:penicillin-binding protein 1C